MRSLVLLFLLSQALMAFSAMWVVQVTDYTFTPKTLHISLYDTVFFNKSNNGFHNVHEFRNYFFCSTECAPKGTGTCPNAGACSPTTTAWTTTVNFTNNGTYNYQCDEHGPIFGMNGTIVVGDGITTTTSVTTSTGGSTTYPSTTYTTYSTTGNPTTTTTTSGGTTYTTSSSSGSHNAASGSRPFYWWWLENAQKAMRSML